MNKAPGHFVISLDFELYWGMFDRLSLDEYGENVLGVRTALPKMLEIFTRDGIHATWATVGMLMARSKEELLSCAPEEALRPRYSDMRMSAYQHLDSGAVGESETSDRYHFGTTLLNAIKNTPHQEIASHTFSHYYTIDGRENDAQVFDADCAAFTKIASTHSVDAASIVFPRNQTESRALETCIRHGFTAYRGTESHILYQTRGEHRSSLLLRAMRLADHYLNLSGHHTHPLPTHTSGAMLNIPSSRFLRPYSRTLAILEPLKRRRIKRAMTRAAKHGEIFHLWWHPHNFGKNQRENFLMLEDILSHYRMLKEQYGMHSSSMRDIVALATRETE